jgi:hypothetical protein
MKRMLPAKQPGEITMKYANLAIAALTSLSLSACFSLPAGPPGPQGATGSTGATGNTGAKGSTGARGATTGDTVVIVPAR